MLLDCFAIARNDGAWLTGVAYGRGKRVCYWIASRFRASTLAMTGRCNDGGVRQTDVLLGCFAGARNDGVWLTGVANGRGKRACYWIASLSLAMT